MSGVESSTQRMRGDSGVRDKGKVSASASASSYQTPKPNEQEPRDVVPDEPETKLKFQQQEREQQQQQLKRAHVKPSSSSYSSSSSFQSQQNDKDQDDVDANAPSSSAGVNSAPPGLAPSLIHSRSPPKLLDSSPDSSFSANHCSPSDAFSPIHDTPDEPSSSIRPDNLPSPAQPRPEIVVRSFKVEPKVVTRVDHGAQDGFVGVGDVEEGSQKPAGVEKVNRRLRPDVSNLLKRKQETKLNKFLLAFRIFSFVFCLISFSVMAADKKQGWALDSYYVYKEFRYAFAVNIIGFVYSGLQIYDQVNYLLTKRQVIENQIKRYLDFYMDQVLTYLLMSASSSAATRAFDWESNWGKDKFPDMANASIGLSFVAFVSFAFSSLISGYHLCRSS